MELQLSLWDFVIDILHSVQRRKGGPKRERRGKPSAIDKSNMHNPTPINHTNVISTNIDNIPSKTKNSDSSPTLYVFEDNEAVIKMIMKCRSPTMRHVSRTNKVALDWLFDKINLDPKFKSVTLIPSTKSQTSKPKGNLNFTRDIGFVSQDSDVLVSQGSPGETRTN